MEGHLPKGPASPQAVVWRLPRRRHVTDLIRWPFGLCSGMIGFSQPANDMALLQVHIAVAMLAQVALLPLWHPPALDHPRWSRLV